MNLDIYDVTTQVMGLCNKEMKASVFYLLSAFLTKESIGWFYIGLSETGKLWFRNVLICFK